MFRTAARGNSTTPTPRKESLFDRLRRRFSQGRLQEPVRRPLNPLPNSQHLSRSTGTLVRTEDFDDRNSVNTSSLESDAQPQILHGVRHFSSQNLTDDRRYFQQCDVLSPAVRVDIDGRAEQERKRLVSILSNQGVSLLQSLDAALKKLEKENAQLKRNNRKLSQSLCDTERNGSRYTKTSLHIESRQTPENKSQLLQLQQQLNKSASLLEEKMEDSSSLAAQVSQLISQNDKLLKELASTVSERNKAQEDVSSLKRQLSELQRSKRLGADENYYILQNKFSDLQREKETNERQLQRDLQQAKDECMRMTTELSKTAAILNESRNEYRQLNAKYEANVLQQAELTRSCHIQSAAYQELQKRVAEMAEDQITNDTILQATIQMAKKADKERKHIYGVVQNTGKVYETYFNEFETDAQTLRAKLKSTRAQLQQLKVISEKRVNDERAKYIERMRARDEELSYLRALLGNRDCDISKAYSRYTAATELLGMTLLMEKNPKVPSFANNMT